MPIFTQCRKEKVCHTYLRLMPPSSVTEFLTCHRSMIRKKTLNNCGVFSEYAWLGQEVFHLALNVLLFEFDFATIQSTTKLPQS